MAKVYVIVEEGYQASYGSYPYLIGVFHDKEKAESLIKNSVNPEQERAVIEIESDIEFPLSPRISPFGENFVDTDNFINDYPLGGYAE